MKGPKKDFLSLRHPSAEERYSFKKPVLTKAGSIYNIAEEVLSNNGLCKT